MRRLWRKSNVCGSITNFHREIKVRFIGLLKCYSVNRGGSIHQDKDTAWEKEWQEAVFMKGYFVSNGYMGLVDGSYMLFASEEDYLDYLEN